MNLMLLALMLAAPPAQSTSQPPGKTVPPTALAITAPQRDRINPVPGAYILGPDDEIGIHVTGYEQFNQAGLVIPPDGRITVDLLPPITATGMTVEVLARELKAQWSEYLKNIAVTVSLLHRRPPEAISVYGHAPRNGPIEYRPTLRLLDAVAQMGGAGTEGDLSRLNVTHRNGTTQTLDLSLPETKANAPANIILQEGDLIYVPLRNARVTVTGEVTRPGDLPFHEGMKLMDAISEAGSYHSESADLSEANLSRGGKTLPLDLEMLYRRGHTDLNIAMEPGDSLYIPEVRNRIYVFGAVGHSGYFNFKPGDRVLDALTSMGGYTQEADIRHINVIFVDKAKSVTKVDKVNLDLFLRKGDLKQNLALSAGNVLFVPTRKKGLNLVESLYSLRLITGLAGAFGF